MFFKNLNQKVREISTNFEFIKNPSVAVLLNIMKFKFILTLVKNYIQLVKFVKVSRFFFLFIYLHLTMYNYFHILNNYIKILNI